MLSRWPDADKGEQDNSRLYALTTGTFIQLATEASQEWTELEKSIARAQKQHLQLPSPEMEAQVRPHIAKIHHGS